jgi:hypothetical protein
MKYLRRFNESLDDDSCKKITWIQYTQEANWEDFINISSHSIGIAKKMVMSLEGLMGHGFDELDFNVSENINDGYNRIDYQRLGISMTIYENNDHWFYVSLRFSDSDRWVRLNFSSRDVTYYWKCDQDTGLEMIPDKLIEDVKASGYGELYMRSHNLLESKNDPLVVPITHEEYGDWAENRYVGLPNEKAKWAMIDSIKLFEESLVHQSSKLSGKYDDNNMYKSYMDTHLDPGYKKLQWTYHRITSSVSDFQFSMFEGDDYWFIIRLYVNYHYYHYKVDDIVGIESLYDSIKNTREEFFW